MPSGLCPPPLSSAWLHFQAVSKRRQGGRCHPRPTWFSQGKRAFSGNCGESLGRTLFCWAGATCSALSPSLCPEGGDILTGRLQPHSHRGEVSICPSQKHLLLFSMGDRLPDVVGFLVLGFLITTTFFPSLACLHYEVSMETLVFFPLTLGRCRGAARPPPAPHRLASSPVSPLSCIWEVLLTTLLHYPCLSLPSSWGATPD